MAIYIHGIGILSPQHTFGDMPLLDSVVEYSGNRLTCIEPDYTGWIDAKAIRRMSRILKMGVTAAGRALQEAGLEKPDAIITGTALGCLDDTGIFLTKMIENNEHALNPTPFIQSTHNTIGSQVALLLKCYGYNQTYSHRAFSFENALLDALMMADETPGNILVGGVDEVTNVSFDLLKRFDLYKKESISNLNLFKKKSKGTIVGEGATYFLMSGEKRSSAYAIVKSIATLYKPGDKQEVYAKAKSFLSDLSLTPADVDLVLLGKNGDEALDEQYDQFANEIFPTASTGVYKHLCGEYETASAFALWLAASIIRDQKIPASVVQSSNTNKAVNRILLYNQYLGSHHSFILVESC